MAAPRAGAAPAEEALSLKVMRLCKPGFSLKLQVPTDNLDIAEGSSGGSLGATPERAGGALSGLLTLPLSFGDIYLGETFSCYISLANSSAADLASVGLKVEVQTQLQRETLSDSSTPEESIARFAPRETLDRVIKYELKDVGIHILICSAVYTAASGERPAFRKRDRPYDA